MKRIFSLHNNVSSVQYVHIKYDRISQHGHIVNISQKCGGNTKKHMDSITRVVPHGNMKISHLAPGLFCFLVVQTPNPFKQWTSADVKPISR